MPTKPRARDRRQVIDNFYVNERIAGEEAAGRASTDPGLFYRFRFGSTLECICIDTSKEPDLFDGRLFNHPKHKLFFEGALPDLHGTAPTVWRIPFGHHPPFSAGPGTAIQKGWSSSSSGSNAPASGSC